MWLEGGNEGLCFGGGIFFPSRVLLMEFHYRGFVYELLSVLSVASVSFILKFSNCVLDLMYLYWVVEDLRLVTSS